MNQELFEQLERMVDKHAIEEVITALADVCAEKADHIAVNWQDHTLAATWSATSKELAAIASKLEREKYQ